MFHIFKIFLNRIDSFCFPESSTLFICTKIFVQYNIYSLPAMPGIFTAAGDIVENRTKTQSSWTPHSSWRLQGVWEKKIENANKLR